MSQAPSQVILTRDTLTDMQGWSLPAGAWERIRGHLGQLEDALNHRDLGEVGRLTSALLLNAPRRVSDPESPEAEDGTLPPDAIEDQVNQLVHTINLGWPNLPQSSDDDLDDDSDDD